MGHRLRRRPNIKPASGERLVFAGSCEAFMCLNTGCDNIMDDYCIS